MKRLLLEAARNFRSSSSRTTAVGVVVATSASCWAVGYQSEQRTRLEAEKQTDDPTSDETAGSAIASAAMQIFANNNPLMSSKKQGTTSAAAITDIIAKIQDRSDDQQGVVEDTSSSPNLLETLSLLDEYKELLTGVVAKYGSGLGDVTSRLVAPAIMYYLEKEDSVKNPTWKRRIHRFCRGIGEVEMDNLNFALSLASLSYADTRAEILQSLEKDHYQVLYCSTRSAPGKPAHYLAVKRESERSNKKLEVLLVIRGSKTTADTITDLLCDPVDYRDGKAHSFILQSGQFISKKHLKVLRQLRDEVGEIDLNIVGHSLGAGAATIVGMELRDEPGINVKVVGFGCPALLSRPLAESTSSYVTTVVNNDDLVPRMSGASVVNLLMEVAEFDWVPYAEDDIRFAFEELTSERPYLFPPSMKNIVLDNITSVLRSADQPFAEEKRGYRLDVELLPPGKCVHFYRDGVGFSGCIVPNTLFSEIDVSRTLVDDHLFHNGYEKTLLEIERQRTGDHHFKFEGTS